MSDYLASMQESAKVKGLIVVEPRSNELFIDIDDAPSLAIFMAHVGTLQKRIPLTWEKKPSPSGAKDRFHITVELSRDVRDPFERIMLQALLGSDRLHEILSWNAAAQNVTPATVFFERPKDGEGEGAA